MRFIMLVKASKDSEAGVMPDATLIDAMGKYNEELSKAGVLLALDGIHPTSKGFKIRFDGAKRSVVNGPFADANMVAGYWVIQVSSHAEAVEWAKRCPHPPKGDTTEVKLQLRRIDELQDLDHMPEELKERERELRAQGFVNG